MIHNHIQPTPNYIAERFKFVKCAQQPDESISEFMSVLKGLSVHCDFGDTLLERLHDKLLSGVKSDRIHQKLLAEENLTYDYAVKLATSIECALAESAIVFFFQNPPSVAEGTSGGGVTTVSNFTTAQHYRQGIGFAEARVFLLWRGNSCQSGVQCVDSKVHQWCPPPPGGRGINTKMVINVKVKIKLSEISLPLYVVEKGAATLLGRDWLKKLEIKISVPVCKVEFSQRTVAKYLSESYSAVFAPVLGMYTKDTVALYFKQDAKPQYHKARTLPFALNAKVYQEVLDMLVKVGVLKSVEFTEWATPIVPIIKKDGTVRICGDYKITINPVIETGHYPVPRIEDILNSTGKCKKFRKIDFSKAYQQVLLDENSRKYVAIIPQKGLFQYSPIPFGISSGPGIFQRLMKQLLVDIESVVVFLDNILFTQKKTERPIAFASHSLTKAEVNYSQIEKESLALMFGGKHCYQYLYGTKFVLVTNHKMSLSIFGPKKGIPVMATAWLQRYAVFCLILIFDTVFDNSECHGNADDLSRLPPSQGISEPMLGAIADDSYRAELLQKLHCSHMGIVKIKSLARAYFCWPSMDKRIEELGNSSTALHIDFLGQCTGKLFLVMVDVYTKWLEAAEVPSTVAIHTISFLKLLMARFGTYTQLVSDNGPPFTPEEFQTFVQIRGIHHVTSPPYHPQSNGQAESCVGFYKYKLKSLLLSRGNMPEKSPSLCEMNMRIEYDLLHSTGGELHKQHTPTTLVSTVKREFQAGDEVKVYGCQEKGSINATELVEQEEGGMEKSLEKDTGKTGEEGQEVARNTEMGVRGMDVETQALGVTGTLGWNQEVSYSS
ncbi:hypothetical protein PR048_018396 [Dryococelus australis]|uniref:RNA-directed DNA polymerase n=1 Tax=Dryococelus australis TaxID=614101 RepID=A0ABQ9HC43_9NEOP|nr:hypothetical protein PR048_018396 [Dryococelus australis]